MLRRRHIAVLVFAVLAAGRLAAGTVAPVSFNEQIRPILAENCFACHGRDESHREAGRRLDIFDGATAEQEGIRAIVPENPEASELWLRITSEHDDEIMPPADSHKKPLTAEQREVIRRWIEQGAPYQNHWAYEPILRPALPAAAAGTGKHPVDRFIGAKLAAAGLHLASEAPREVLLRRLTLDLTGLPPTTAELDAFLADKSPRAYELAVDRLLASPRYGEHFARAWLDAVRYADTHGLHLDNVRQIWPYRDWVVRAFNRNLPFDRFTVEQIAGDLLPDAGIEQLVASGYNRNHLSTSEGGTIAEEAEARNTADWIDTTASVWLGLTANCASCHDHKFDPLTQREYYSLGAFFKGIDASIWDGNMILPAPIAVIAPDAATQRRIDEVAAAVKPLEAALSARADELEQADAAAQRWIDEVAATVQRPEATLSAPADEPEPADAAKPPSSKRVTYEVVWAEDSDLPTHENFNRPSPGEWREGPDVPVAGGRRALRLEGAVARPFVFTAGDVLLEPQDEAIAFVHLQPDPANPPRAVSLEFLSAKAVRRIVWGDPAAFGPECDPEAIHAGPLPPPGTYTRLALSACDAGLEAKDDYTGIRVAQSDGAAWWDRAGAVCTSPNATGDPLLSYTRWKRQMEDRARSLDPIPLRHDFRFLTGLSRTQHAQEDTQRLKRFHRDFILAPLRAALEPEAHAARRLMAEQIHYEMTLPATLVSRERSEPRPAHVLIRGQYDKPGDRVDAATPAFLPPLEPRGARADRLDLARWMVSPRNPLTARVAANRLWQQVFGAGLVRTPNDFGTQGDPPTHPALLDWLASELMAGGWDIKGLVRLLVTSRTYRQDGRTTPQLLERDPGNKLLARSSRLRLDGEVLRDQALAVSGLLVGEMGGPPVKPYQPGNIWEPVAFGTSNTKEYVQDHGPALYRRSLYTFWKRTAPPPAMVAFDAPAREAFCVVRGRSNTPLQALVLLNDVQQFEAARAFAERLLRGPAETDPRRLARAFRTVTARRPTTEERKLLLEALATQRAHFSDDPRAAAKVIASGESKPDPTLPPADLASWTMVANLLLNLDEAVTRN